MKETWQDEATKGIDVPNWELEPLEGQGEALECNTTEETEPVKVSITVNVEAEATTLAREAEEIKSAQAEIAEFFNPVQDNLGENIDALQEEAIKLNSIKDYEKKNGVDQDIIAESYLAFVDNYHKLSQKNTDAMNKFHALENSNGPKHPETIAAQEDWLEIADIKDGQNNTMQELLNNLTEETKKKYRQDFVNHGAINRDFLTEKEKGLVDTSRGEYGGEVAVPSVAESRAPTENIDGGEQGPNSSGGIEASGPGGGGRIENNDLGGVPSPEDNESGLTSLESSELIKGCNSFEELTLALDEIGDITSASDGYVHKIEDIKLIITQLRSMKVWQGRPTLQNLTGTFGLRDKVEELFNNEEIKSKNRFDAYSKRGVTEVQISPERKGLFDRG